MGYNNWINSYAILKKRKKNPNKIFKTAKEKLVISNTYKQW